MAVELAFRCQCEGDRLGRFTPVDGRYISLALVPQAEEREGGGGGVERVVVSVEERALLASQVTEGYEPLLYFAILLSLSLKW